MKIAVTHENEQIFGHFGHLVKRNKKKREAWETLRKEVFSQAYFYIKIDTFD